MESAKRAVMDGLVVGDAVAEQVEFLHGIMHIPAHPAPFDAREGSAKAREPKRALVSAGK